MSAKCHTCAVMAVVVVVACTVVGVVRPAATRPAAAAQKDVFIIVAVVRRCSCCCCSTAAAAVLFYWLVEMCRSLCDVKDKRGELVCAALDAQWFPAAAVQKERRVVNCESESGRCDNGRCAARGPLAAECLAYPPVVAVSTARCTVAVPGRQL